MLARRNIENPLSLTLLGETCACSDQRGFIAERMMVDNIGELDTFGRIFASRADHSVTLAHSKSHLKAVTADGLTIPAMVFFDFAAAFPSLAWSFMWLCMRFAGLPGPYIRAFQKLYVNNNHFLKFMGQVFFAYVNMGGVKTGGPASSSLFVLCIDPFLIMLRAHAPPGM